MGAVGGAGVVGVLQGEQQIVPGVGLGWFEADGVAKAGQRGVQLAQVFLHIGQVAVQLGHVRRLLQRGAVAVGGFVQPAARFQQIAQVVQRFQVGGDQRQRAPVAGFGLVAAVLAVQDDAQIIVRQHIVRLERQRLPAHGFGFAQLAALAQHIGQVVQRGRVIGAQFQRAAARRLGLAAAALFVEQRAQVVIGVHPVRVQRQRLAVALLGQRQLAHAARADAQIVEHFRVVGQPECRLLASFQRRLVFAVQLKQIGQHFPAMAKGRVLRQQRVGQRAAGVQFFALHMGEHLFLHLWRRVGGLRPPEQLAGRQAALARLHQPVLRLAVPAQAGERVHHRQPIPARHLWRLQGALQVGQRHFLLAVVPVGHAQLMMGVVLVGVLAEDVQIVVDGLGKLAGALQRQRGLQTGLDRGRAHGVLTVQAAHTDGARRLGRK